jgi:hypothetical protein
MWGLSPARHGFESLYFLFRLSEAVPVRKETKEQLETKKNWGMGFRDRNVNVKNDFRDPSLMSVFLPERPRAGNASVRLVYAH